MNDTRHRDRGLRPGTEDCVAVFADRRDLITRIESALLRKAPKEQVQSVQVGDLCICPPRRVATWRGRVLDLSPKEFDILAMLAQYVDQDVSRSFLFVRIWSEDFAGEARLIDRHIMKLRQKLGDGANLVETVQGMGYRLASAPGCSATRRRGGPTGTRSLSDKNT